MLIEHAGRCPQVDDSAYVAPTAVLCGDVRIGAGSRILFGAVLTAETGSIEVGERCIVMETRWCAAATPIPRCSAITYSWGRTHT